MGRGFLVDQSNPQLTESHGDEHRFKCETFPCRSPSVDLDRFQSYRGDWTATTEVLFARMGGFREDGVKAVEWIVDRINNLKLNHNLGRDLGGVLYGKAEEVSIQRTSLRKKVAIRGPKERRQLFFARVADSLDPATKETLQEVKEDAVAAAEHARVPIPQASLPYFGLIHSLTLKTLVCGTIAGAVAATVAAPFQFVQSRVIAGQGGHTAAQVLTTVAQEEGLQTLMKGSLSFNIAKTAFEKGLQFSTFEFVKRYRETHQELKTDGKFPSQKKLLPLPRQIPVATVGGAAAGFVGTLLSYPFQPIMERLFLQPDKYKSLEGTVMQVLRNEGGVFELYRGITPALIAIVPNAALSFYTYETLKKKYLSKTSSKPVLEALQSLIIGGLAGAISTTITYPLEAARKHIVMSALPSKAVQVAGTGASPNYNNIWQALNGIVRTDGWQGLYRGSSAQNAQIIPITAVSFMVYELAKRAFVAVGEERRDEVKDADDLPTHDSGAVE